MSSIVKCCFDSSEMPDVLESMAQKCTDPGCKFLSIIDNKLIISMSHGHSSGLL